MEDHFKSDIDAIANIPAVPTILEVICQITGMGFAAVARVTDERWIACSVRDEIQFGLQPGGELDLKTTICHEIQTNGNIVAIDQVSQDKHYCTHHTPILYGFESYISVPIILKNGQFFGTLCAIDPKPAQLNNPKVVGAFKLFSELIAFHLDAHYKLIENREALAHNATRLTAANEELEAFSYSISHDLRTPLRGIDGFSQVLAKDYADVLDVTALGYIQLIRQEAQRMGSVIDNLMTLSRLTRVEMMKKSLNLSVMAQEILKEFQAKEPERVVKILIPENLTVLGDEKLIRSVLKNLLSNAWKFTSLKDEAIIEFGQSRDKNELACFYVRDNGAGFNMAYSKKLYSAFQRLHGIHEFPGVGIGLATVQRIVSRHGGRVWAEGEVGQGAIFYFTL